MWYNREIGTNGSVLTNHTSIVIQGWCIKHIVFSILVFRIVYSQTGHIGVDFAGLAICTCNPDLQTSRFSSQGTVHRCFTVRRSEVLKKYLKIQCGHQRWESDPGPLIVSQEYSRPDRLKAGYVTIQFQINPRCTSKF